MHRIFIGVSVFTLLLPFTCLDAHHSSAAYNIEEEIQVTGIVTEYSFRNPHVYMTLEVENADGSTTSTEIEAGAASVLGPLGFTRDSVALGDTVTVIGNPNRRNPAALILGRELYHQDGSYIPLNISSRSIYENSDETATSIAGTWFSPRTSFFGYLGTTNQWEKTAAGMQNSVGAKPLETTHKDCIAIGAPGLMFYPVANTISVEGDRVIMDIDWLDTVRTIYMDGRDHPPADQTFLQGHSVGHWEGEALVVDTTNFSDHPMGTSMSVPGSVEKHLVERFEVSADGREMAYSGEVTDPLYLVGPHTWSGTWIYSPTMQHSNESCDLETARKFLDD